VGAASGEWQADINEAKIHRDARGRGLAYWTSLQEFEVYQDAGFWSWDTRGAWCQIAVNGP
jgi:hypothetical protein